MKLIQRPALFAIAMLAFLSVSSKADNQIPVRVVVITAFQEGADDDPTKGEFGNWVLNLPLPQTIPFPQGYHHLRYNPELQVLGIVTGQAFSLTGRHPLNFWPVKFRAPCPVSGNPLMTFTKSAASS